ncbi:MAG: hypothetical protein QF368_17130, partial [SAR202 cluster bacterium]|nr:hypothetical protein [SAR202 cluster bacterium]
INPYTNSASSTPANHVCEPIAGDGALEKMRQSLTYNTYFDKFMIVGEASQGGNTYGFFYSLSDDLINWSNRHLILETRLIWDPQTSGTIRAYPSIIDPSDTSRNFENSDQVAYLYYTKFNTASGLDRDLVRQEITFSKFEMTGLEVNRRGDLQDTLLADGKCLTSTATCGIRAAIEEANGRPPYYRNEVIPITFNVTGSGLRSIKPGLGYPTIRYPVYIDGYTQPTSVENTAAFGDPINAVPLIRVNGEDLSPGTPAFNITGGTTTVRGMIFNNFTTNLAFSEKGGNTVEGVFIGTTSDGTSSSTVSNADAVVLDGIANNTVGGSSLVARNLLLGRVAIRNAGADNNVVKGNYLGTDINGDTYLSMGAIELTNGPQNNIIGGLDVGNLVSGSALSSIAIAGSGHRVYNNLIGTNASGTAVLGASRLSGIGIEGANHVIGSVGDGNVVADAREEGIIAGGTSTENMTIQGNFIGTDKTGTLDFGNSDRGIYILNSLGNHTIRDNTFANNGHSGVGLLGNAGNGIAILQNSFYSNGLGIDLGLDGVTQNDGGDTDGGTNGSQNFPVLSGATTSSALSGGTTTDSLLIAGILESASGTQFRLEFFSNPTCNSTGWGEGKTYIGHMDVTTASDGEISFSTTSSTSVAAGYYITSTATDPNNNTSEFSKCALVTAGEIVATADLSVTKTDDADPVTAGNNITYTVTITNNGPSTSTSVVVTDPIPSQTTFVSASSACSNNTSLAAVVCNLGDLASSGSSVVQIVLSVASSGSGSVTNVASATSSTIDLDATNNTATSTTAIQGVADLAVAKSDAADPVIHSQSIMYTIGVTNNGPGAASGVTLTDILPPDTILISASATQGSCTSTAPVVCTLGNLSVGNSATATVAITTFHAGEFTNTATVDGDQSDPVSSNDSATEVTTVTALADLNVSKVENSDPVTPGSNLSYTITVQNGGPSTSTNVMLTDSLPAGVSYIVTSNGCVETNGVVSCALGDLAASETATRVVQVTVLSASSGTVLTNTASATSTTPDGNASNNTATITTTIQDGVSVPGLSAWGTLALFGAVAGAYVWRLRRRQNGLVR